MIVLCIVTMLPAEANEVIYNDVDDRLDVHTFATV